MARRRIVPGCSLNIKLQQGKSTDIKPESLDILSLERLSLAERKQLPHKPAVYFLILSSGELIYIGSTLCLWHRFLDHHVVSLIGKQTPGTIYWFTTDNESYLRFSEKLLIYYWRPRLNIQSCKTTIENCRPELAKRLTTTRGINL